MKNKSHFEAEHFLNNEKQFHLGVLPTEQSNPKTKNIDLVFKTSPEDGVQKLIAVDYDVATMAARVIAGAPFRKLADSGIACLQRGGKIVFSGCGATGRLSILLESIWRKFFAECRAAHPVIYEKIKDCENSIFSIMTGGDYALVRSVESFEDYASFGRRQAEEMQLTERDMLVAITEGGETSSVLGTVDEAVARGSKTFLLFNNPAEILRKHIERSRRAIENPRVTVLDLYCGPMAIAGSTRMQATTSEQLVAGAALERILAGIVKERLSVSEQMRIGLKPLDCASAFKTLLDTLSAAENITALSRLIAFEADLYRREGLVTYFAERHLLDIFTDTTERAPTFMLPPFRKCDNLEAPPSWAFVKNPRFPTPDTWIHTLARSPRCLEWTSETYRLLGASDKISANPPALSLAELLKFTIGNEPDPSRTSRSPNAAVMIVSGSETAESGFAAFRDNFDKAARVFDSKRTLVIGTSNFKAEFQINVPLTGSPLRIMDHLAVKLVLNTLSTATMIVLGRVTGNWMSWVEVSNKKLKDRGIRLISELCGLSYRDACYALHETLAELEQMDFTGKAKPSPVQYTIRKLGRK